MESAEAAVEPETAHETPRPIKVLCCIPSHGDWKSGFGWSLARAVSFFEKLPYDGEKSIDVEVIRSSILPETRTRLVSRAYKFGATHILWLDTDMKFPIHSIVQLLNHNKLVVAANYCTKEIESRPVAYREDDEYVGPVWTKDASTGLEKVTLIGMGLMLVDLRVFDSIELPWFVFNPQGPEFIKQCGEDAYFCNKLREAGIDVWVDHDLSKQVVHIGDWEYANYQSVIARETKLEHYNALPGAVVLPGATK